MDTYGLRRTIARVYIGATCHSDKNDMRETIACTSGSK